MCHWVKMKLDRVLFPDNSLEIRSLSRLKYRDKATMELRDSSTIKIEFANLLPKFLSIWSVWVRVRPYINRVRKCFNCFRWGYSSIFCRGRESCSRCGQDRNAEACDSENYCCVNCEGAHHSFDQSCPIFYKYELINAIMTFCNVNQFLKPREFLKLKT